MKKYLFLLVLCSFFSCDEKINSTVEENKKAPISKELNTEKKSVENISQKKTIVFFGNSLTAAYGLDPLQGFTSLIEGKIDSLGLSYKVVNAGLSGETTAGGNSRIDWILRQKIDVFVLELGANDGLRGTNPAESYKNLMSIIQKVKTKYPDVKIVLCAMEAMPNMGEQFTSEFRAMYPKLAEENNVTLVPFLLNGVGGIPELNQADGIHPTAKGHKIVAENIWTVLKKVI